MNNRLKQQIEFITEIDKLKTVLRRTTHFHSEAFENSAEHSWHLALMAMTLSEYANEKIDVTRVIKMLLIHDLVEVYTGDTFIYDTKQRELQKTAEAEAAGKLFSMLPDDQKLEFKSLWTEFESKQSADAKFAEALDRLQPMLVNSHTGGGSWARNGIKAHQVRDKNKGIEKGSVELWKFAQQLISDAVSSGKLKE